MIKIKVANINDFKCYNLEYIHVIRLKLFLDKIPSKKFSKAENRKKVLGEDIK